MRQRVPKSRQQIRRIVHHGDSELYDEAIGPYPPKTYKQCWDGSEPEIDAMIILVDLPRQIASNFEVHKDTVTRECRRCKRHFHTPREAKKFYCSGECALLHWAELTS